MASLRIAVIGSGASGLAAIKCCLDEGLRPVCFEKSHDIGGLWRYDDVATPNKATVYKNTYSNSGKTGLCFSDFPTTSKSPNNPHHSKVLLYYRAYAEKFNLLKHINFNTAVVKCIQDKDFDKTGKWIVKTKNMKSGDENEDVFDGVMVAVGHHAIPYLPLKEFQGIENFKGVIKHSQEYRDFHGYEDKNVLVIGLGNSGADIAVELSWHAKQVFASTRTGTWVFGRSGPHGMPFEECFVTRYRKFLSKILPASYIRKGMEDFLNMKFSHAVYGLKPKHGPMSQHPTINDDLPHKILNGSVIVKPNVTRFTADSAIFRDGTEEKIDAIVFATGFDFSFPFLDDSVIKRQGNFCTLYKFIWPVDTKHNTLAMIGHVQALAAINPVSEIQSRWATRVFKGLHELPGKEEMLKDVEFKKQQTLKNFYNSPRHFMDVDHVDYMDEVASEIGAKPNLWKLLFTDPKLAYAVFFSFCSGFQFRLEGPGKNKDARKYILNQRENIFSSLRSRNTEEDEKSGSFFTFIFLAIVFAVAAYYVLGA